jgi:hypothetical protein
MDTKVLREDFQRENGLLVEMDSVVRALKDKATHFAQKICSQVLQSQQLPGMLLTEFQLRMFIFREVLP